MYDNIGGKIKGLAKIMFIVEAIGAVITGIVLLATDDDLIFAGLLTLFCGPIIAWVSSWVLYAFGELVEDIHSIRNKYYPIAKEQADCETEEKAKREESVCEVWIEDDDNDDDDFIDVECPKCGHSVLAYFDETEVICSNCRNTIKILY